MADPLIFVIEEASGTSPIRVELQDHDLPFGRPRRGGAFDMGGPVNIEDILLDGRSTPIIHTKQADQHPTVIKGHLRDHFTGIKGHAQAVRSDIEKIRSRMRPLKLSISNLTWTAFLRESKFPYEGDNDLTYELTFRVLKGVGVQTKSASDDPMALAPADLMATARALLVADQAAFLALSLSRVARTQLALAFDNAARAANAARNAAQDFENAGKQASREANNMIARCQDVKSKCDALISVVQALSPATGLTQQAAGSVSTFTLRQIATVADAADVKATMRTLQLTARQRIRKTSKLYQIAADDTIESIATSQLGSASRSAELGLRTNDLIPGKYIRIPVS